MNILFVDQFGQLGGAQRCLLDLIPGVLSRGWRAVAAVPADGPLGERLRAMGVEWHPIVVGDYTAGTKTISDVLRFSMGWPALAQTIRDLARRHSVGLIYVNGPRVLPAASMAGRPLLFHAHNHLGASRWIARAAARWSEATVVAVSRFAGKPVAASMILPNGVADHRRDRPAHSGLPRIGVLGRIAPGKGQLDFLEATRDLPAELVICGAPLFDDPGYSKTVQAAAGGLPVQFLGWRDDVADVLARLDLLVVPSTTPEAAPRVILEAFSADVPVVAYPLGGIPELIADSQTGFLTTDCSPIALRKRIEQALAQPELMRSVAQRARAAWAAEYTLEAYRDRIIAAMHRAAGATIAAPPPVPVQPPPAAPGSIRSA